MPPGRLIVVTGGFNSDKVFPVDFDEEEYGTALQFAAFNDSELIVKYLLEAGADVNLCCEGYFEDVRHS